MKKHQHKIAEKIKESKPLAGLRLYSLKTSVKKVVTIQGSLLAGRWFGGKNPMLAELTAALLSEGTKERSKKEINEELEGLGASIEFSVDQFRLRFKVKCLKPDTKKVLGILAEELREPRFDEKKFAAVKKRTVGAIRQQEDDTYFRALSAASREVFPKNHPNYVPAARDLIAAVEKTQVKDLENFHRKNFGLGNMIIAAVGDVNPNFTTVLAKEFSGWQNTAVTIPNIRPVAKPRAGEIEVIVPDKTSVDVIIGTATGLTQENPDFDAFALGLSALGEGATSRLFQEVREKNGLTYHVQAGIEAGNDGVEAAWLANGTFAPSLFRRGLDLMRKEIRSWAGRGIAAQELKLKKEAVAGKFEVGLSNTAGLAKVILSNAEQGRNKEYLDQYPEIIRALSLKKVNEAIKKYSRPNNLVTVCAGTL